MSESATTTGNKRERGQSSPKSDNTEDRLAQLVEDDVSEEPQEPQQEEEVPQPSPKKKPRKKGVSSIWRKHGELFGTEAAGDQKSTNSAYDIDELKGIKSTLTQRLILFVLGTGVSAERMHQIAQQMEASGIMLKDDWKTFAELAKFGFMVDSRIHTLENPKTRKPRGPSAKELLEQNKTLKELCIENGIGLEKLISAQQKETTLVQEHSVEADA